MHQRDGEGDAGTGSAAASPVSAVPAHGAPAQPFPVPGQVLPNMTACYTEDSPSRQEGIS